MQNLKLDSFTMLSHYLSDVMKPSSLRKRWNASCRFDCVEASFTKSKIRPLLEALAEKDMSD
jgi:hypothetical protein